MKDQESTTTTTETPDVECQFCDFRGTFAEGAAHRRQTQQLIRTVTAGDLRREQASAPAPQPVQDAGETWELSTGGLTIYRRKQIAYVPIVQSCYAEWQEGSEQWPNKAESREIMQQIVRDHPAAQAVPKLVAALSSIRARVSNGSDFANIIDEALAIAQ
jgi:hypothetical protein